MAAATGGDEVKGRRSSLDEGYVRFLRQVKEVWPEVPDCHVSLRGVSVTAETFEEEIYVPTIRKSLLKTVGLGRMAGINTKRTTLNVVTDLNLDFKPGTSTLIVAPPGHGKSTVLQLVAGQCALKHTGKVLYNGSTASDSSFNHHQLVSLVGQDDVHMPQLTVRETLQFAHDNANTHKGLPTGVPVVQEFQNARVETILRMLGLESCADTYVGNDLVRGVSGGEKRRVSIGEMIISNARCLCLDQYSTGLDASTTIDITRFLSEWTRITNGVVVATLLQPPPEVVELFDNLVVLREGRVLYQGPRADAQQYFAGLGYECPSDMDFADFLLEMITDPVVWSTKQALAPATATARPCSTQLFVEAFSSNPNSQPPAIESPQPVTNAFADAQYRRRYPHNFWFHFVSCLKRQLRLIGRDQQFIMGHIGQSIMLGLILGSLFWNVPDNDFQLRVGILLFVPTMLAFNNMAEVPVAIHGKRVVFKQRESAFYPVFAYVMAANIAHLPLALAEAVIFGSTVYWMTDFVNDAGRYLFFILTLLVIGMASAVFFRSISYMVPSMEMGQVLIGPANAILVLFGGVMISRKSIPDWLIWMFYNSPFSWITRSLAINEFESSRYDTLLTDNNQTQRIGDAFLEAYEFQHGGLWKWAGVLVVFGQFVLVSAISALILRLVPSGAPIGTTRHTANNSDDDGTEKDSQGATNAKIIAATTTEAETDGMQVQETSADGQEPQPYGSWVVTVEPEPTTGSSKHFPFEPINLVFDNIGFEATVKDAEGSTYDKVILNGVSGSATPGRLLALMGQTGAGKTSLLDVVARRKTGGRITGTIAVNGQPLSAKGYGSIMGYVEQNDLHDEQATVEEAIHFSARLRLPKSVTDAQRHEFVEEILHTLELSHLRGRLLVSLSKGQLKRVTIGVELAANSSLLLCDEPTSSLDSREAQVVMRVIRRVAHLGRTVVCTIHQPNEEVFSMFDDLLLLAKGGLVVFNGPMSDLQPYLESIPGVEPKPVTMNPATWMLDVIGAGVLRDNVIDFPGRYSSSELRQRALQRIEACSRNDGQSALPGSDFERVSSWTQFTLVLARLFRSYNRNVGYNVTRIITFPLLGIMFGLVYRSTTSDDLAGVTSTMAAVFMTSVFSGAIHLLTVLPVLANFRAALTRETASGTYVKLHYSLSLALVELPFVVLCSVLFLAGFYNLIGFSWDGDAVGAYMVGHLLVSFVCLFMAQFLAFALPSAEVATLVGSSILSFCFTFGGLFIPGPDMPAGYRWIWHTLFMKYGLNAMIIPQFYCEGNDCPTVSIATPNGTVTSFTSVYVQDYLGLDYEDRWSSIGVLVGYAAAFWGLALAASMFFNHVNR